MSDEEDSYSSFSSFDEDEDFDFSDSDDEYKPTKYAFSKEDYKKGYKLGEGAFASVYRYLYTCFRSF